MEISPAATLKLTSDQVIALVMQLSPKDRLRVLAVLQSGNDGFWDRTHTANEAQLAQLAAKHGLDWKLLGDEERQNLVDRILHVS